MGKTETLLRPEIESVRLSAVLNQAFGHTSRLLTTKAYSPERPSSLAVNFINQQKTFHDPATAEIVPSLHLKIDKAIIDREINLVKLMRSGSIPAGLLETLSELESTVISDGEFNEDFLAPGPSSVLKCRRILEDAMIGREHDYPHGSVTADGDGGIRVEWRSGHSAVMLAISESDEGSYVYRRKSDKTSSIIDSPTGEILSELLGDLVHGQSAAN
jgi:hypothetical protein